MDSEFPLDYADVIKTIRSAEVITIRFVAVPQRLLIDSRYSEVDPPLVKIVPRVTNARERFRSLKQLRPRFRMPQKISAIWWPKFVDGLVEHGVWGAVVQRIEDAGFPEAAQECERVLNELRDLERREVRNAILGDGYQALWER